MSLFSGGDRSTSACIDAWVLGRSLRAVVTKVPLFLASETLACFHKLRSFVCVNSSGPRVAGCGVHGVRVATPVVIPS